MMSEHESEAKPAPAADISDYEMETIRDPGSGIPLAVAVVVALIIIMLWVMR